MTTQFVSSQIKGKGRGKFLGYPTINLKQPVDFELEDGIYAAWVVIDNITFRGAMHWGPIPTFEDDGAKSLEIFLLGLEGQDLSQTDLSSVQVTVVKKVRDIIQFASVNDLTSQIAQDVRVVRSILTE